MSPIPSNSPRSRVLARGPNVFLRTPTSADEDELLGLRAESWSFLAPWEPDLNGIDPLGHEWYVRYMCFGERWNRLRLLVCSRTSEEICGSVSLANIDLDLGRATVGYWIGERFARRGYMGEALELIIELVSPQLGLRAIDAFVLPENTASKKLLEKTGFRRTGRAPDFQRIRGESRDHERWTVICPSPAGSGNPG